MLAGAEGALGVSDGAAVRALPVASSVSGEPLVIAEDLARDFDVSSPWLERLLSREPRRKLKAVDGVDFAIPRGRTLALVGESGCGKSTVARLVTGLYAPSRGRVLLDGVDVATARGAEAAANRRRTQMIFQDPYASLNPRWRVGEIVSEPARVQGLLESRAACEGRVAELLELVGLRAEDARKYPHQFSGGQRQRISIARALSSSPEFLVCDEPTSALDVSVQAQVLNLLQDLQASLGLTCLFISHNLAVVEYVADEIGVMYLGRIVELGPREAVLSRPSHPYTRLLLDAVPDLAMTGRARTPVGGEVPSPIDPPSGCAFHPRCPWADARCRSERPASRRAGDGRTVACHAVAEARLS
jgi:peptide/nickel transport system ATP-binding protein